MQVLEHSTENALGCTCVPNITCPLARILLCAPPLQRVWLRAWKYILIAKAKLVYLFFTLATSPWIEFAFKTVFEISHDYSVVWSRRFMFVQIFIYLTKVHSLWFGNTPTKFCHTVCLGSVCKALGIPVLYFIWSKIFEGKQEEQLTNEPPW